MMNSRFSYFLFIPLIVVISTEGLTTPKNQELENVKKYHTMVRRAFSFDDFIDDVKETVDNVKDTVDDIKDTVDDALNTNDTDGLLKDLGLDDETINDVKDLLSDAIDSTPNVRFVTKTPPPATDAPSGFNGNLTTTTSASTAQVTTTDGRRGRTLIKSVLSPVVNFVNRFRNITQNLITRLSDNFGQRLEQMVADIESRLNEMRDAFESRLSYVVLNFVANLTSDDMQFLSNIQNNKTREFMENLVDDILPVTVGILMEEATLDDLRCAITENVLEDQFDSLFKVEQLSRALTDLMLSFTGCNDAVNNLNNFQQANADNRPAFQAMTELLTSQDEADISAATSILDAFSFANPSVLDSSRILEQLTIALGNQNDDDSGIPLLRRLGNAPRNRTASRILDSIFRNDQYNENNLVSNLLKSILDPLPLNEDQTDRLTNLFSRFVFSLFTPTSDQSDSRALTKGMSRALELLGLADGLSQSAAKQINDILDTDSDENSDVSNLLEQLNTILGGNFDFSNLVDQLNTDSDEKLDVSNLLDQLNTILGGNFDVSNLLDQLNTDSDENFDVSNLLDQLTGGNFDVNLLQLLNSAMGRNFDVSNLLDQLTGGDFDASNLLSLLGSSNVQEIMRSILGQNGSVSQFLPSQLSQALEILSTVQEAGKALANIYGSGFNTSQRCQLERSAVRDGLQAFQPWSLLFVDSLGKPATGILQGNTYFVGNFDQCKEIRHVTSSGDAIEGHYVKYRFAIPVPDGFPVFESSILSQESGLPYVVWGVCLPKGCGQQDARTVGEGVAGGLGIQLVGANILDDRDPSDDAGFICTMLILGGLGFFCLIGTFLDLAMTSTQSQGHAKGSHAPRVERRQRPLFISTLSEDPASMPSPTGERADNQRTFRDLRAELGTIREHEQSANHMPQWGVSDARNMKAGMLKFFVAFSLTSNTRQILNAKHTTGDISCLHGIRVISISWVILGHTYFFAPDYGNLTALLTMSKWWTFNAIRNATYSVDTFFLLSGCLVAYLFLRTTKKAGGLKPFHMVPYYVHRYLRLTPLLGLAMLFYGSVTPYLEYGPFQKELFDREEACKEKWWWNILYINNMFDDSLSACMGWTWYLPNDMQFYVIAPLVIVPLALGYKFVGIFMALLQISCHIIMFTIMEEKYEATLTENALDYFNHIYIKPYTRCGPYAIGLLLGYALFKTKSKVKMHPFLVFTGWVLAWGVGLTLVFITHDNYGDYGPLKLEWSTDVSNAYEIVVRPLWALCVAWVVLACSTGYGGVINTVLSWEAWIPLSRLTYGVYLFHVMVMQYFNNNRRSLAYLTKEFVIQEYLAVFVLSYGIAFVASLLVETPIRNLTKPKRKQSRSASQSKPEKAARNSKGRSKKVVSFDNEHHIIGSNPYSIVTSSPHPAGLTPTSPSLTSDEDVENRAVDEPSHSVSTPTTVPHPDQNEDVQDSGTRSDDHGGPSDYRNGQHVYPNLAYVCDEGNQSNRL